MYSDFGIKLIFQKDSVLQGKCKLDTEAMVRIQPQKPDNLSIYCRRKSDKKSAQEDSVNTKILATC